MISLIAYAEENGMKEGVLQTVANFLSNGGSEADAQRLLGVTAEDVAKAKKMVNK